MSKTNRLKLLEEQKAACIVARLAVYSSGGADLVKATATYKSAATAYKATKTAAGIAPLATKKLQRRR